MNNRVFFRYFVHVASKWLAKVIFKGFFPRYNWHRSRFLLLLLLWDSPNSKFLGFDSHYTNGVIIALHQLKIVPSKCSRLPSTTNLRTTLKKIVHTKIENTLAQRFDSHIGSILLPRLNGKIRYNFLIYGNRSLSLSFSIRLTRAYAIRRCVYINFPFYFRHG